MSNFGYLPKSPLTPSFDSQNTTNALIKYQKFNSLQQTGKLDSATIKRMQRPRCGLPDDDSKINYNPLQRRQRGWVKVQGNQKTKAFGFAATINRPTLYFKVNATTIPRKHSLEKVYTALELSLIHI